MARVTVEDCIEKIPNRFDLVLTASQRARGILKGDLTTVDRNDDKNPVVALREIADETLELNELEESLIKGLQRFVEADDQEDNEVDILSIQHVQDVDSEETLPQMEKLSSMYLDAEIPAELEEESNKEG